MKKTTNKKDKSATKSATKSAKPKEEPIVSVMEAEVESPEVLVAQVISLANNPRYVYASLNGEKITVSVPAWMAPNLLRKPLTIVKTPDSEHYEIFKDGN